MTKREMYNAIINLAMENERQDIADFAQHEIELLDKRNSKESKAAKAKVEERKVLAESILNALSVATGPKRTMDIATAVHISPQKATPILKDLVSEGRLVTTTEKGVKLYNLPNAAE